jgi:hypothetical protein
MYPHRIRLRGPWTLKSDAGVITSVNIHDRSTPELAAAASAVHLCRRFSWVQELQAHERLWLVLEQSVVTTATLNDMALELSALALGHQECEITSLTRRSNQLTLNVAPGEAHRPFPHVALEVRCRTFLRQPTWQLDAANCKLEIAGLLVGLNETPLELYVRVGALNVLYVPVHANEPSSPFRYQCEIPAAAMEGETPIQIDLVNAGSLWHRVTGRLASGPEGR